MLESPQRYGKDSARAIASSFRTRWMYAFNFGVAGFRLSPPMITPVVVLAVLAMTALLVPWVAPHNPSDPGLYNLEAAFTPPVWQSGGAEGFLLGTDDQGRDVLSCILFGARLSLIIGFGALLISMLVGVCAGLLAGYCGGWTETIIMRLADVQLTMPALLVALILDGFARALLPVQSRDDVAMYVLIAAIGIADWPRYARVVRGLTLVECHKAYVDAAFAVGVEPARIMWRHVLPNVAGPILVLGTIGLAQAITAEAALSFLGVGMPPTEPSLGTMIQVGKNYMYSGEWWIVVFPSLALVALVFAANQLSDGLRGLMGGRSR